MYGKSDVVTDVISSNNTWPAGLRNASTVARLVLAAAAQTFTPSRFTICHNPEHEIPNHTPFQSMCDDLDDLDDVPSSGPVGKKK